MPIPSNNLHDIELGASAPPLAPAMLHAIPSNKKNKSACRSRTGLATGAVVGLALVAAIVVAVTGGFSGDGMYAGAASGGSRRLASGCTVRIGREPWGAHCVGADEARCKLYSAFCEWASSGPGPNPTAPPTPPPVTAKPATPAPTPTPATPAPTAVTAGPTPTPSGGGCVHYGWTAGAMRCSAIAASHSSASWKCNGGWGSYNDMAACCAGVGKDSPGCDSSPPAPTPTPKPTPRPTPTPTPTTPAPTPNPTPAPTPQQTAAPVSGCPAGWTFRRKSCLGLPVPKGCSLPCGTADLAPGATCGGGCWGPNQKNNLYPCLQTLPPTTVQQCGPGMDLTAESCLQSTPMVDGREWCENPNPTKNLVCGGNDCGVPEHSNSCVQVPAGGRGSIRLDCPNPVPTTPAPTPAATATPQPAGDKIKVVFRLDDVQSFWSTITQAQTKLLDVFAASGVKLNAGIVADARFTAGTGAVGSALKAKLAGGGLELFNHGADGATALEGKSESAMNTLVANTQSYIRSTFGVTPAAFVPHQNKWDNNLVKALVSNGMSVLSTSAARGGSCGVSGGLMRAKAGASTMWSPSVGLTAQGASTVYAEIKAQARECGFAVVMMHPQEYAMQNGATNTASFARLQTLLDLVKADSSLESGFFSELKLA